MFTESNIRVELLQGGRGALEVERDGWLHVKTVPCCIFAQATLGRYELLVQGERHLLAEGEAFLVPANLKLEITHHVNPDRGRMEFRWLHFRFSLFGALDFGDILDMPRRLDAATSDRIGGFAESILALGDDGSLAAVLKRLELGHAAFGVIAAISPLKTEFLERQTHLDALVEVLGYIKGHLHRKLGVEELAAKAHMSRSGFHAHFVGLLGCSPQRYVLRERLELAAGRLLSTGEPLGEIAAGLGFQSQFHFSRCFKRRYGVPPARFRERFQTDAYGRG